MLPHNRLIQFFLLALLASSTINSQPQSPISELRTSIIHAVDPGLFLVAQVRRLTVPRREMLPFTPLLGNYFVLEGSVPDEEPSIAFVVTTPVPDGRLWPQAVWLACLDSIAAMPRKSTVLFALIPYDCDRNVIMDELSEFMGLSRIIVFEDSRSDKNVYIHAATGKGNVAYGNLKELGTALSLEGLRVRNSPFAGFFLRLGFIQGSSELLAFQESEFPAVAVSVNFDTPHAADSEAGAIRAFSSLASAAAASAGVDKNYFLASWDFLEFFLSERQQLVILIACLGSVFFYAAFGRFFMIPPAEGSIPGKPHAGRRLFLSLPDALVFVSMSLVFLLAFRYLFYFGFRGTAAGNIPQPLNTSILILAMLACSFFTLVGFQVFSLLRKKANHQSILRHVIFTLFLFDVLLSSFVYFQFAWLFALSLVLFVISWRKAYLSFACLLFALMPSFGLLTLFFFSHSDMIALFQASVPILSLVPVAFFLGPFFLWFTAIFETLFDSKRSRRLGLVVASVLGLAIIGLLLIGLAGKVL